ncbi:polar amino acid transport system substrate-binding protein [uncultured Gammaproteobacteria bacterium]
MTRILLILCTFWLSALGSSVTGHDAAADPIIRPVIRPVIRLCTSDWPPYTIKPEDGKPVSGLHTDIVLTAFERLGFEVEIQSVAWERCLNDTAAGLYDGLYSASFRPERAAFAIYPKQKLRAVSYVVVVSKGAAHGWTTARDAAALPQPIAVPHGFSIAHELQQMPGVTVDSGALNDMQNLRKLLDGRVGTMIAEQEAVRQAISAFEAGDLIELLDPPYQPGRDYFVIISRKFHGSEPVAQALADRLDRTLETLRAEGEFERVERNYLRQLSVSLSGRMEQRELPSLRGVPISTGERGAVQTLRPGSN